MWRHITNILLVVLLLLSIAFVLRVLSSPIKLNLLEYNSATQAEQAASQNGTEPSFLGDIPNWLQFIAAAFMTVFSYFLWQLTGKQAGLLSAANNTAAIAVGLTRESIAVQIESSRAVLGLIDFQVDRHSGVFRFAIKNLGQSPATIVGMEIRPSTSVEHLLIQHPSIQAEMAYPLMSGEKYVWDEHRMDTVLHPITAIPGQLWHDQPSREKWNASVFAVSFFYHSMGGDYINRTAIQIFPDITAKILADTRVTYDGPVPVDHTQRIEPDR